MRKKIVWVTADYFIDVDIDILELLAPIYDINWIVIIPKTHSRYTESYISKRIGSCIKLTVLECNFRFRSLKYIPFYYHLLKLIKNKHADVIYINFQGFPYFGFLSTVLLDARKTIFAVHQSIVHEGMQYKQLTSIYFTFLFNHFNNFHLFSKTQERLFKSKYFEKNVFMTPLALKNYGVSNELPPANKIVFLNFGKIIKNKNIGLLIEAGCNLFEKGYRNFEIIIAGSCENWNQYEEKIKYPEIFKLQIMSIPNDEIPNLYCTAHYLVLPYSAVSQSGPLKIAYNYNIPVIASDLEEFKNEITDNLTGYLFENSNLASLQTVLMKAIDNHYLCYESLKSNQLKHVRNNYDTQELIAKYVKMLNTI